MPDTILVAVFGALKVQFPIFFAMIFFSVLDHLLTINSPNDLNELIYPLIQTPSKDMDANIITVLILGMVINFFVFYLDGNYSIDGLLRPLDKIRPLNCIF